MFSFTKLRSVLWLPLALAAGCGGKSADSGLEIHTGDVAGTTSTFKFHTDACLITDCASKPRFAVDDPEIVIRAERNSSSCLPPGWTLRVADTAVATIEPAATTPDLALCQGTGMPAFVKLHPRAVGSSQLEILDDEGAVADAMPFASDVATNVALHVFYAGTVASVSLHSGDRVELWSTLHDAAGGELAASGDSRVWTVDGAGVTVLDVTADQHRGLWPWLAGDALGDAMLHLSVGPLQASIPVHVTR